MLDAIGKIMAEFSKQDPTGGGGVLVSEVMGAWGHYIALRRCQRKAARPAKPIKSRPSAQA